MQTEISTKTDNVDTAARPTGADRLREATNVRTADAPPAQVDASRDQSGSPTAQTDADGAAAPQGSSEPVLAETDLPHFTWCVRLLRAAEKRALRIDHEKFTRPYAHLEDEWWVAYDGEMTGPLPWSAVLDRLLYGYGPIEVVHASQATEEAPPWTVLNHVPMWSSPGYSLGWRILSWGALLFAGYLVVRSITPYSWDLAAAVAYWLIAGGLVAKFQFFRKRQQTGAGVKRRPKSA